MSAYNVKDYEIYSITGKKLGGYKSDSITQDAVADGKEYAKKLDVENYTIKCEGITVYSTTSIATATATATATTIFAPTKKQIAAVTTAKELIANDHAHMGIMAKDRTIAKATMALTVREGVAKLCQSALESGSHQGLTRAVALALGVDMPADGKLATAKAWVDSLPDWAKSAKTAKTCEIRTALLERFDVAAYLQAFAQLRTMHDNRANRSVAVIPAQETTTS